MSKSVRYQLQEAVLGQGLDYLKLTSTQIKRDLNLRDRMEI